MRDECRVRLDVWRRRVRAARPARMNHGDNPLAGLLLSLLLPHPHWLPWGVSPAIPHEAYPSYCPRRLLLLLAEALHLHPSLLPEFSLLPVLMVLLRILTTYDAT